MSTRCSIRALTSQNALGLSSINSDNGLLAIFALTITNSVSSNDAICNLFGQGIPTYDNTLSHIYIHTYTRVFVQRI